MSTTTDLPADPATFIAEVFPRYAKSTGPNRYARFVEEVLDMRRTFPQDQILRALHEHKQVYVEAANGVGKSYIAAAGGQAALWCNPDTIVNVTAGNSGTLKTNIWKPARSMFRDSILRDVFQSARTLDGTREIRTGLDDEWFFECVSPRYPDDLEGPHNNHVIYIVEEANKPGVTAEHIEAVRSTATDDNDRALVIANPPSDEGNVVYDLAQSDEWHTLRFATWDSHNVRVDRGLEDSDKIDGLADTSKLVDDWHEYHDEPWPGLDRAIEISSPYLQPDGTPTVDVRRAASEDGRPVENDAFREELDERWYRRRAGIMPPGDASTHRPVNVGSVRSAYERQPYQSPDTPSALAVDVARSGDRTVMYGVHADELVVHYAEKGTNHVEQEAELTDIIDEWPEAQIAVDAVGEGSGLADALADRYPNVHRFAAGSTAANDTTYRSKWAEALALFGEFLDDGGAFSSTELRAEALAAARTVRFDERFLKSRGKDGATVLEATSKDDIKDVLGYSPDHLDAAIMAVWAEMATPRKTVRRRSGNSPTKGNLR